MILKSNSGKMLRNKFIKKTEWKNLGGIIIK
jgi:hypothetical protein